MSSESSEPDQLDQPDQPDQPPKEVERKSRFARQGVRSFGNLFGMILSVVVGIVMITFGVLLQTRVIRTGTEPIPAWSTVPFYVLGVLCAVGGLLLYMLRNKKWLRRGATRV